MFLSFVNSVLYLLKAPSLSLAYNSLSPKMVVNAFASAFASQGGR